MANKEIKFDHTNITGAYEDEANEHGYTLNDPRRVFDKLKYSVNMLSIRHYISERQYEIITKHINKDLNAALVPLPKGGKKN